MLEKLVSKTTAAVSTVTRLASGASTFGRGSFLSMISAMTGASDELFIACRERAADAAHSATIIFTFTCAAPFVLLISGVVGYGVRSLIH